MNTLAANTGTTMVTTQDNKKCGIKACWRMLNSAKCCELDKIVPSTVTAGAEQIFYEIGCKEVRLV